MATTSVSQRPGSSDTGEQTQKKQTNSVSDTKPKMSLAVDLSRAGQLIDSKD